MKTVGMIGGMSWHSTQLYYQIMNQEVQSRLGKNHSLEAIIYSVDFERMLLLAHDNRWDQIEVVLIEIAKKLQTAGCDFLMLTANTLHKLYPQIQAKITIPILHICDPLGKAIQSQGISKVGLLGTQVTMEETFYQKRLQDQFGVEVITPEESDRRRLQSIIFEELTVGNIFPNTKSLFLNLIERLLNQGAQGIILACTELSLLLDPQQTYPRLFDTTTLHAKAAVDLALTN